jgi:hypothetical protein
VTKWIVGGGSVLLIGLAIGFGADAGSMSKKLENAANQVPPHPFDQELMDAQSRGKRDEALAWITGISGAAAVGATVFLFVMDKPKKDETTMVVPAMLPGGVGAAVLGRF